MKIKRVFNHDLPMPARATPGSAGFDLRANRFETLRPGQRALIPTGFAVAIPQGWAGLICPRSGLALAHGITVLNAPGIIDSDYRGEIGVILHNLGNEAFSVGIGDRIAQLVLKRILITDLELVEDLDDTDRGAGGFGSTGIGERPS
jgi:dUTP pyrophosphatase